MRLSVLLLLALLLWTVPVAGKGQYMFQEQDATPAETEAHITAQESVVYVGESVNFTCSTKSRDIPKHVAWLMYEEDMSAASFVTITTSEGPAGNGFVLFISTLTIIKALFNHTSIVRCRIKVNAQTVLYLSTPLTVSQNTTRDGKRIGDQCTADEKCPLEHSTCKPNNAESTSGTCQCDTEHPVLSSRNDYSSYEVTESAALTSVEDPSRVLRMQAGSAIYPVAVSSSLINPEAPSYAAMEGDLEAASPAEAVLVAFCL
ncbi:hypothetical protein HPB47_000128 [Ixodes persulcatus]|uniref:Uncharacterized protein n=1 Tax=Ixodes persulcatus TaxID=34615 RepID=A0AC60PU11_IXOPE|nr:hypothetical protein HPB47_000128 [Ixodes persulcatus]